MCYRNSGHYVRLHASIHMRLQPMVFSGGSALWKKMCHYFQLNRDEFVEHYHKRSNIEAMNAAIKRKFGETLKSKNPIAQVNELLAAIEAFAEAMEVIPKTLAENAGFDQIDSLVSLRSQHENGVKSAGLDIDTGKPVDMMKLGVVEPLRVKTQAIQSAAEAAVMILRIDDVIASKKSGGPGGMPGAGGHGEMPGGMGGEDFD